MTSTGAVAEPGIAPQAPGLSLSGLVATLAAGQALGSIFNLARTKSVAVYLGPVGVGTVSLIDQLVYAVALIASFGLPYAGLTYLAKAEGQGAGTFAGAYRLLLHTLLAASMGVALVASLLTLAWPNLWGQELAPYAGSVALGLLAVPVMALHGLQLNLFAALRHPRLAGVGRLGSTLLMTLGAIGGLVAGGLLGFYAGTLVAGICAAVVLVACAPRRFGLRLLPGGAATGFDWRQQGDLLRLCGTTYVISVGQPVAFLLARYAIAQSAGLGELGLFQSAYGLASSVGLLLSQTNAYYLTPLVNRRGPLAEKTVGALGFQRHLAVYATVVAVPLVLFPRLAIAVLFSDAFVSAAPYLVLFVLAEAVLLQAGVLQALLIGLGDFRSYLVVSLGAQVLLVTLVWALAPSYGLWGVGLAFVVAHGGMFVGCLVRLVTRHHTGLPGRSAVVLLYSLVLVVAAGWLGQPPSTTGEAVAVRVLFFVGACGGVCLILTGQERAALRVAGSKLFHPPGA